jgi:uncharacterized protein with HEPN domain
MPRDARKYLFDIQHAATRIREFTGHLTAEAYFGNTLLQSAVERQFEIIGEALTQLRKIAPDLVAEVTEASRIIGFRNVLIHGYAEVDNRLVWNVIETKLPILIEDVARLWARVADPASRTRFERYIGIDYSGADTSNSRLRGLCVYEARRHERPGSQRLREGPRGLWSRAELAEWLTRLLSDGLPTIVGIDHGFSFPLAYFQRYPQAAADWPAFLDDFVQHWPTDQPGVKVRDVRNGQVGEGSRRVGENRWYRLTERRGAAKTAKPVFLFDVNGTVAHSTHAGIPWLRYLRNHVKPTPHFWPFDGWTIAAGRSAIVEVYPRMWSNLYERDGRNGHQQDAYAVSCWLCEADEDGRLAHALDGPSDADAREAARMEGWILGTE